MNHFFVIVRLTIWASCSNAAYLSHLRQARERYLKHEVCRHPARVGTGLAGAENRYRANLMSALAH